jgi:hypothetical protein
MSFSDLEEDLDLAVRTIREAEDDGSATVIIVSTSYRNHCPNLLLLQIFFCPQPP